MLWSHRYAATIALGVLTPTCSANIGSEQNPPAAVAAVPPVVARVPAVPAMTGATPWSSGERSTRVEERQGDPVSMLPGERCTAYRRLPGSSYAVSTVIQDACLEIPSDTIVEVRDGATLVIVATNSLKIGKDVQLNARGAGGHRGRRSPFANVERQVDSEAEIRALCIEHGNRCTCPAPLPEAIQGKSGEAGSPGGNVRIVAGQLLLTEKLNIFASDVSGGPGGPPGDSGTQECRRGEVRCSSPACSGGAVFGTPGPAGNLTVEIGSGMSATSIAQLKAHTTPASALIVADLGPSILERAVELDREAMQKGWQRRAGRTQ